MTNQERMQKVLKAVMTLNEMMPPGDTLSFQIPRTKVIRPDGKTEVDCIQVNKPVNLVMVNINDKPNISG